MTPKTKLMMRFWYYFRIGYSTYLSFLIGYASMLVTLYYLAIKNIPSLNPLFPNFSCFAVIATAIGGPISGFIGWLHMKRTSAYASEADISVEANPWNYKLAPGVYREVIGPLYLEVLSLIAKASVLSDDDKLRIEELKRRLLILNQGGTIGTPRRKAFD